MSLLLFNYAKETFKGENINNIRYMQMTEFSSAESLEIPGYINKSGGNAQLMVPKNPGDADGNLRIHSV